MTRIVIQRTEKEKERIKKMLKKGESLKSDGRLSYRYTDIMGKRQEVYGKTFSELREKERSIAESQKAGLTGGGVSMTLNAMWAKYFDDGSKWKNSTAVNYEYLWETYIRDSFIGKKKLTAILYQDVYDFYMYLHKERGLEVNTLESIHTLIHPTLTLAVRNKVITSNPSSGVMKDVKRDTGWKPKKRPAVSDDDFSHFMDFLESSKIFNRWFDFFVVLFGTGCRIGEHLGLTWEDIDFENHEIDINHQLVYRKDRVTGKFQHYISSLKKDASERVIPMTEDVEEAFKRLKLYQETFGHNHDLSLEYDGKVYRDFIFLNTSDYFHTPGTINRSIDAIILHANREEELKAKKQNREPYVIKDFSCHQARHTFASELCRQSNSLHDLQCIKAIMGHSSIGTTADVYAEVNSVEKSEFMAKIKGKKSLKKS